MSLIRSIQAEAIEAATSVSSLLRKCKLLAARLDHAHLAQWVEWELNGYPNGVDLPPYRVTPTYSYGNFAGMAGQASHLQIPVSVLPEALRDHYRVARLGGAISSYENLVQGDKAGSVHLPWDIGAAIKYGSKIASGMQCHAAWQELPIGAIDRLLDAVKNAVLGYAIDIEKVSPNAGELPMGTKPISEERLTQIFNTNIAGSVGNVANGGTGFTQTAQVAVGAGDWDALRQQLLSLGLKEADLAGLQADLDEARAKGTGLEGKPQSWMGRLAGKAIEGAAGVGVEALAGGVAKAIGAYLGVS
ncbi:hypothetical protein [Cupriavidus sp. UME77]|uniref:AbiTii domain-containing protein n=1 Tax=Cupriavidus sp. UME77 TaxID=1862321 RepID=UPI0016010819|nr:hypothetical protein [Cupriavidus sp. UME77]MBB1634901.1 hypothetical protein [Cupriavidus sp. UME77]